VTDASTADTVSEFAEGDGQGPAKATRERSTIIFPYDDLATAVRIAAITHDDYGGRCDWDQLASKLKQKPSSGGFRLKVSAARIFGLTRGTGQTIEVTDLGGQAIAEDAAGAAARSQAFLRVPLYKALYDRFRNRSLPTDEGLEAAIRDLGVSAKQVTTARQAFQRSADLAGFFGHGRDRLVMPPAGRIEGEVQSNGGADSGEDQPADTGRSVMSHPLIVGLLGALPEPGSPFTAEDRQLWLQAAEVNFSLMYGRPSAPDQPSRPPESTPPQSDTSNPAGSR